MIEEPYRLKSLLILITLLVSVSSCRDNKINNGSGLFNTIDPSKGFLARQKEYLDYCTENNGPGQGGIHGQVCRAFTGAGSFNEDIIYSRLEKINNREDTSDFDLNSILRILYLDRGMPSLPDDLRDAMEKTVLDFKYWLDEPGSDTMCWWSENHQILFHTAELLAGRLFPDSIFSNSGMTGDEHVSHALPLIEKWIDYRGRFGFAEWHSNVYFNEDMPALLNLVDFAGESPIRIKAAMLMDILTFDMAGNYYKGTFATTHGRTYPDKLLGGLKDSTREAAYILAGLVKPESITELSAGNFTACFLTTSDHYRPPAIMEGIANGIRYNFEHRQRDGITIEEGPEYGIGYEEYEDVMFWWGRGGYAAPETVAASLEMIEEYNLWEGFLGASIEDFTGSGLESLRPFMESSMVKDTAEMFSEMSRGVVLEAVSTYTYRTPYYQISGAQDYKPANWTAQVHVWQATIDEDAYVFTTYPGAIEGDNMAGLWTGSIIPRGTIYKNVGIFQYRRPKLPELVEPLFLEYTHAYFPKNEFEEIVESGHWTMGRKGDAYLALYSQHPTKWALDNDYELIARSKENVWIVELGDIEESGSFTDFINGIEAASVTVEGVITYESPSRGIIKVGWTGPMTVNGRAVDIGPYPRWDNPYCIQEFGGNVTVIKYAGQKLELDFETPRRRFLMQ